MKEIYLKIDSRKIKYKSSIKENYNKNIFFLLNEKERNDFNDFDREIESINECKNIAKCLNILNEKEEFKFILETKGSESFLNYNRFPPRWRPSKKQMIERYLFGLLLPFITNEFLNM